MFALVLVQLLSYKLICECANKLLFFIFQFYYVNQLVIRFGEYYRPGQLAFYKSSDYGQSYEPWHYFVSNVDDCQEKFGVTYKTKPTAVNDVLCMEYTSEAVDKNDVVCSQGSQQRPAPDVGRCLLWNLQLLNLLFYSFPSLVYGYSVCHSHFIFKVEQTSVSNPIERAPCVLLHIWQALPPPLGTQSLGKIIPRLERSYHLKNKICTLDIVTLMDNGCKCCHLCNSQTHLSSCKYYYCH